MNRPIELLIREKDGFRIESLHSSLQFLKTRPRRIKDVEVRPLEAKQGERVHFLVKNTRNDRYLRFSAREMTLWNLMDGTNSVHDIAAAFSIEHGSFDFEGLRAFLGRLRDCGLLEARQLDILRDVSHRLGVLGRIMSSVLRTEYSFKNLDNLLSRVHRAGARFLFTWPGAVLMAAVGGAGFVLFWKVVHSDRYRLFVLSDSVLLGLVFLLVVFVVGAAFHELAHALTCKHFGRKVKRAGFLLDFGRPVFFADTTDIWMADKRARIATYLAGPFSSIVLAGAAATVTYLAPSFIGNTLLIKLAFYSYSLGLFQLCPVVLLDTDGYRALVEVVGIPGLKYRSGEFMKRDLLTKIRRGVRLTGKELAFITFILASVATFSAIMSFVGRYVAELITR